MRISLTIPPEFTVRNHGYAEVSYQIVKALQSLGYQVPFQDATAPVELAIGQPYHWNWSGPNSYKIGLVAWESTKIPDRWRPGLATADEVWTPSPLIAEWFAAEGVKVDKVYQHGVDTNVWTKRRRRQTRREGSSAIRFLHVGEPASRKGGQLAYDAFKELFGNQPNRARLTIKAHGISNIRGSGNVLPHKELNNVTLIRDEYTEDQMVDLFHRHDVLLYPSAGEGFGLIPLQAMATGMPVICTEAWAPYKDLLVKDLKVDSILGNSPWPNMHPGQVFFPGINSIKNAMLFAANNFEIVAARAFANSLLVKEKYDWKKLTEEAFAPVAARFD